MMVRIVQHRFKHPRAWLEQLTVHQLKKSPFFKHIHVQTGYPTDGEISPGVGFFEHTSDIFENQKSGAAADLKTEIVFDHVSGFDYPGNIFGDLGIEWISPGFVHIKGTGADSRIKTGWVKMNDEINLLHRERCWHDNRFAHRTGQEADILGILGISGKQTDRSA